MSHLRSLRYSHHALHRCFTPFLPSLLFSTLREGWIGQAQSPVQPGPPPIRVAVTDSAGRGVFATRRIGAGELIHTAKPVVAHPSLSAVGRLCYFCLRKTGITGDDPPRSGTFCRDCEEQAKGFYGVEIEADWSAYNDYCRSRGLKYPLLVKRFACMVISGAVSSDLLDVLQPCSLSPMISEMEEGFLLLKSAFEAANIPDEKMTFLTKQWYIGVLSRIRINAFRIELAFGGRYEDLLSAAAASVEGEAAIGTGVYMLPSFYNHDCDPNAHIIWIDNVDAKLTALRDVEEGEELRICYIDASMDRDARQAFLSQGFGFRCNCPRCLYGD